MPHGVSGEPSLRTFLRLRLNSPWLYIAVIVGIWLILVLQNMPYGTAQLIGWDNLLPQLNFWENIRRAIFGVWQGHQGLGHVGGHGYAATLPHSIILYLITFIVPMLKIRAFLNLLMLLVGGIGMFFLTLTMLPTHYIRYRPLAACIASLFYMLNLGTLQNFYIPLEAFTVHFGLLPWLLYGVCTYIKYPTKKNLLLFITYNIAAIPMGFVPPLFVIYALSVGLIIGIHLIYKRTIPALRLGLGIIAVVTCINAFWLFPVIHFSFTRTNDYLHSYSNITTTEEFILKSKKYGNLENVAFLKGFYFDSLDSKEIGSSFHILQVWEDHLNHAPIRIIGYLLFGFTVLGLLFTLLNRKKHEFHIAAMLLFFFSFIALGTDVPGFRSVSELVQQYMPIFRQAFRIAFTKFSINLSVWYAVFLGIAIGKFFYTTSTFPKKIRTILTIILPIVIVLFIIALSLPSFEGYFFYRKAKLPLPAEYTQLLDFFKQQDANGRIANLPQGWRTGWSIYNWGYSGSGFLWYGLPQPLLDRSFDTWSHFNENYYWELSDAIYQSDWSRFDALMQKYNVTWILYDQNSIPFTSGKESIFSNDLASHLSDSPLYKLAKTFHDPNTRLIYPVYVYRVNTPTPIVSLRNFIPNVLPITSYNDRDPVLDLFDSYSSNATQPPDVIFPFRSLFTGRTPQERTFQVQETDSTLTLSNSFTVNHPMTLNLPSYLDTETFIPTQIIAERKNNSINIVISPSVPLVTVDGQPLSTGSFPTKELQLPWDGPDIDIAIFDQVKHIVLPQDGRIIINTLLSSKNSNTIMFFRVNDKPIIIQYPFSNLNLPNRVMQLTGNTPHLLAVTIQKNDSPYGFVAKEALREKGLDPFICAADKSDKTKLNTHIAMDNENTITFSSKNDALACLGFYLPTVSQKIGYLIRLESQTIQGYPLQLIVNNLTTTRKDIEELLPANPTMQSSYLILPTERNDGIGYSINLNSKSIGATQTINVISNFAMWPIPYNFLHSIRLENSIKDPFKGGTLQGVYSNSEISVEHPNPAYYLAKLDPAPQGKMQPLTLILSQSYDPGWIALFPTNRFPFFTSAGEHVLVNNWANGWRLAEPEISKSTNDKSANENTTIVLFFWPQILEWIGFALLPLPFLYAWRMKRS